MSGSDSCKRKAVETTPEEIVDTKREKKNPIGDCAEKWDLLCTSCHSKPLTLTLTTNAKMGSECAYWHCPYCEEGCSCTGKPAEICCCSEHCDEEEAEVSETETEVDSENETEEEVDCESETETEVDA